MRHSWTDYHTRPVGWQAALTLRLFRAVADPRERTSVSTPLTLFADRDEPGAARSQSSTANARMHGRLKDKALAQASAELGAASMVRISNSSSAIPATAVVDWSQSALRIYAGRRAIRTLRLSRWDANRRCVARLENANGNHARVVSDDLAIRAPRCFSVMDQRRLSLRSDSCSVYGVCVERMICG